MSLASNIRAIALPLEPLRRRIESKVWSVTRTQSGFPIDLTSPAGDPGLFGPDSVCWRVHDDFSTMMVGGIRALILQAMHPLALAGVLEYSVFQHDLLGRLARTAQFIAGTTYGSLRDANGLIEHVNGIHRRIRGVAPDGTPYAATDPALLTWVHVAETSSFLAAYLKFMNPRLSAADQDRYFAETATIARRLGAPDAPNTRVGIDAYLLARRHQLAASDRMHAAIRLLYRMPGETWISRQAMQIFVGAAVRLLPRWARNMLGKELARKGHVLVEPAFATARATLRWAVPNSAYTKATLRAGR